MENGIIDAKGNIVIEPIYDTISVTNGGHIYTYIRNESRQFFDLQGKQLNVS